MACLGYWKVTTNFILDRWRIQIQRPVRHCCSSSSLRSFPICLLNKLFLLLLTLVTCIFTIWSWMASRIIIANMSVSYRIDWGSLAEIIVLHNWNSISYFAKWPIKPLLTMADMIVVGHLTLFLPACVMWWLYMGWFNPLPVGVGLFNGKLQPKSFQPWTLQLRIFQPQIHGWKVQCHWKNEPHFQTKNIFSRNAFSFPILFSYLK